MLAAPRAAGAAVSPLGSGASNKHAGVVPVGKQPFRGLIRTGGGACCTLELGGGGGGLGSQDPGARHIAIRSKTPAHELPTCCCARGIPC